MMVEWLTMYMVLNLPKYDDIICEQPLMRLPDIMEKDSLRAWLWRISCLLLLCLCMYVYSCHWFQLVFILFECFPKYICTKFLIFNILTNRSIFIHHQFVSKSFILTWTVNFEPGPFRFKLVFEEINLSNSF